jgi:hypothetical protein
VRTLYWRLRANWGEACYDPENPNSGCNYYRWDSNGTLDNGGTCYLGLWMAGDTPACYNSDPREYPGPDAGARDGGLNGTSQFGFGPCLTEQVRTLTSNDGGSY